MLKICIIVGSQRKKSQSRKVGDFCQEILKNKKIGKNEEKILPSLIDLSETKLPFWHQESKNSSLEKEENLNWEKIASDLENSHGFVFVVPEWGGMVPPVTKNLFLIVGSDEQALFYHKPALIVSVSSGGNGAYPVAELRMSSYKNNHILYLPDHVIVKNVPRVLNQRVLSDEDEYIRKRIEYSLCVLLEYSKALIEIRNSGVLDRRTYIYGM